MKKPSLNQLINLKMGILMSETKIGSYNNYRTLLSYVETHYGIVPIDNVTADFANRMKSQMVAEGKSNSTIRTYFALLTSVWNYACYKKYVKPESYPFAKKSYELDKCKVPKATKRNDHFITKNEMILLYGYFLESKPGREYEKSEKAYLGLFLMSYLCNGANINDLVRLRYDNSYFVSNETVFRFVRHKVADRTAAMITVPIIDELKTILAEIASPVVKDGLVLGRMVEGCDDEEKLAKRVMYINSYCATIIRKVARKLGIRDDISPTFARHTYATVLHQSGANFAVVEAALGHTSNIGIAGNYIGETPVELLFEMNSKLLVI